jgi:exopolysaccharide biosynthesis polyprenyl glycosylphosphotransferase
LLDRFSRPDSGYALLGQFCYNQFQNGSENASLQDKLDNIINYAIDHKVSEIFLMHLPHENIDWKYLIKRAEEHFIRIKFVPDYDSVFAQKINLRMEQGLPIITLRKEPLENIENRIIKRAFDIVFSLLTMLLLLWWLIPILAILIKLSSRGPVFFIQKRSGRNGKVFNCFKLRSMHVNCDADAKAALRDDERLTPFGKFLRRTNLDELPQFFNVLKGEMSVVGPRPHMLKHTREYSLIVDQFMVRHFLKPGLTGWAQVNGFRGDLTGNKMQKRVELDVWYLENWHFILDLKIIYKTISVTIKGDKNAF